ncbi:general transcription factor II-I repeat domain-containing 2A-like [Pelobates cultripes]|uniref:General transcription factor II-I repeat domain-containing 2A-like n=1 Tax=Pelobates cultripes TaxID=61616 RepID=A0AAD1W9G5_PELCU|nr:general transcription factor II-I repeat domain-containing 2A-like [Pelobates cultripes]
MDKGKKIKISEENRVFNDTWTESFAFSTDKTGLPVCLICGEKFANNKKSNIARHFQNKHTAFAEKYPDGDERRKAVAELMRKEELIELIPLEDQTRGEDICKAVLDFLSAKEINTNHLVSVATDGAPSMRGAQKGFVALLQKALGRTLLSFHCILHQEALCAQTFPPECTKVMDVVIQIVNKIMAKGLNHRQFRLLLDEVESTYSDLLLHNKVRWLSRDEVLKRFVTYLEEVKTFLACKELTFAELEQSEWLEKLHFMVDMTAHLNMLNTTLQGKGGTALHMLEEVLAFERKLTVFVKDFQRGTLSHFPSLREFKQSHDTINLEYFKSAITAMQSSFGKRFCEFREEKKHIILPCHSPGDRSIPIEYDCICRCKST